MRSKTKKLIWLAPVMAVFAVAAALAIFAAQPPDAAQAHGLPGAVTNLTATEDGTKAVDLSWTAPTGDAPDSYRIDVSADGQTWSALATTTDTSYRDDKLAKSVGPVRYYRVFAVNSAGVGPVSETVGPASVPLIGAPSGVPGLKIAVAADRKSISLTWNPPAKDGGAPIANYVIVYALNADANDALTQLGTTPPNASSGSVAEVRDTGNATVRGVVKTDDATTSYTLKGTQANETWWFRVYAHNGAKISAAALETRTSGSIPVVNPDPPTGLTAVQVIATTDVNLYWYWPASNGGQTITNFEYQVKTGSGDWSALTAVTPTADASVDLTYTGNTDDISADVTNTFRVRTVAGTGDNVKKSSWASAKLTIDDASIPATAVTGDTDCSARTAGAVRSLCERTQGLLKARVNNANTENIVVATDELTASRDGKGNVEVTIDRENPKAATSFRIDVADVRTGPSRWRPVAASTGNLGSNDEFVYEYQDQATGSRLKYRVFGKVGSIIVPANTTVRYVTQKPVDAPTKVNNLTATGVSATQIDVSWTAPTLDGDAAIAAYCVQVSTNVTGDPFDALVSATGLTTAEALCAGGALGDNNVADTFELVEGMSYSVKKLSAESTRFFRVYAINSPVFGDDNRATASDTIGGTTKAADKPAMPTGLVAEQAKDSNYGGSVNKGVYLMWNAPANPAGAAVDGYRIERMVNDGSWSALATDTKLTETIYHDTSEPAENETRAYRVAARVGSDVGPYSDVAHYPQMGHIHNVDPMPKDTIADMDMVYRGEAKSVDASMYFTDADADDTLTYSAAVEPADGSIATVAITGDAMNMVTVTGVGIGEATITVTASDGFEGGTDAEQMFKVMVVNQMPTASDIPDMSMVEGTSSDAINLSTYFMDADSMDTLTYTVTTSDDGIATASESDGMLTIMAHNNGMGAADAMATITVEASDGMDKVTGTIAVTVTASAAIGKPDIGDVTVGDGSITVEWADGENADSSLVLLLDVDFDLADVIAPTGNTATFTDVAAGTYTVVVVSIHADGQYDYKTETATVQ